MATTSEDGNIIKLFDTNNGNLLEEFRRGLQTTTINYLGFSDKDNWITCSSIKGTVHFFNISKNKDDIWGFMRTRSSHTLYLDDIIRKIIVIEDSEEFLIIGKLKMYSGTFNKDTITIKKSILLLHRQDPFYPSPKQKRLRK